MREQFTLVEQEGAEVLQPGGAMLAAEFFNRNDLFERVDAEIRDHQFEKPEISNERWDNGRTALFEALTASGHLTRVDFEGPAEQVNKQVLKRLLNAYDESLPHWELGRRKLEIAEEITIHQTLEAIKNGELPPNTTVATISDYPKEIDEEATFAAGYRGMNHKGMCRVTYFFQDANGVWCRSFEQISRSNSHDNSSAHTISHLTGQPANWLNSSNEILASTMLVTTDVLPDGVVDLQRILDGAQGDNIRFGDDITNNPRHPEYDELRFVSAEREAQVANYVEQLARLEYHLDRQYARNKISYNQKLFTYNKEVQKIISQICLLSPSYARDARGEESAKVYERAALAMAAGDDRLSRTLFEEAEYLADPRAAPICGGGGIEDVTSSEKELDALFKGAKESRKNWRWKKGICVVPKCRKAGEVGPCDVCRDCQAVYDNGGDPTK